MNQITALNKSCDTLGFSHIAFSSFSYSALHSAATFFMNSQFFRKDTPTPRLVVMQHNIALLPSAISKRLSRDGRRKSFRTTQILAIICT